MDAATSLDRIRIRKKNIRKIVMVDTFIAAENVYKKVPVATGELTILDDLSLDIGQGASVAIVGQSGSGKTTLLGILAGLDTATSGEVWLAGNNISSLDEDGRANLRKRYVGFVFQTFQLLSSLTALENVVLPAELRGDDDAEARAAQCLERVGLGARMKHYPAKLSGGEQQRVALARAFVTNPKVLFADEPTGNLDTRTGQRIIDLMFELRQDFESTLVLVTHDKHLAGRCDSVHELDLGRIVA